MGKDKKPIQGEDVWMIQAIIYLILAVFCIGAIIGYFVSPLLTRCLSKKTLWLVIGTVFVIGVIAFMPYLLDFKMEKAHLQITMVMGFWFIGASLSITYHTFKAGIFKHAGIMTTDLEAHRRSPFKSSEFDKLIPLFSDPNSIPIGLSYPEKEPVFLLEKLLLEHLIVSGATGQGKTTTLIVQVMHNLYHGRPAIIIDPKGDMCDLDLLQNIALKLNRPDAIKVFSLAKKQTSCSYNPLEVGTAHQIVSKLMTACDLAKADNPYYSNIAQNSLTAAVEALHYLGVTNFTFETLLAVLKCEVEFQEVLNLLLKHKADPIADKVYSNLRSIALIEAKDLTGVRGALQVFTAVEFTHILGDPDLSKREAIHLLDVLNSGGVAYFQMNVNGYESMAKRLGKLLLEDLKLISSMIQSREVEKKFSTAAVFVDEFGIFAQPDFMSFLKMSRTAGISLRLFFQGLEDLKLVSESFEGQTIGNSIYKLIFRAPSPRDAETIAETAGTVISREESFQVSNSIFGSERTGLGNQKESFQFKVHPNDLKKLGRGQAILINADAGSSTLFQTWDAKEAYFLRSISAKMKSIDATPIIPSQTERVVRTKYKFTPRPYLVEYKGFTYALTEEEFESYV